MDIVHPLFYLLFLCLGFWMGSVRSNQGIPKMEIKKKKPILMDDPYEKAMHYPPGRKETVT